MKKTLSFILCAAMLLMALAGCSTSESTPSAAPEADPESTAASESVSTEESTPEVEPAESSTASGKVAYDLPLTTEDESFTFFIGVAPFLNGIMSGFDDNIAWTAIQEKTGINLEFVNVSGQEEATKFSLLLAADDLPELVQRGVALYGSADAAIQDGFLVDIGPYLEEYAPNYNYYLSQNDDIRKMLTTDSGGIASFTQFKTDIMFNEGYAVRADWLDAVGMEAPSTYDELHDVLYAFQTQLDVENPLAITYNEGVGGSFCWGYDITSGVMVKDGVVSWGVTSQEYYDYLCMIKQWMDEGLIDPNSYSYTSNNDFSEKALNGELGFYYVQSTNIDGWVEQNADPNAKLEAVDYIVREKGAPLHFSPMMINSMEGKNTFVNTEIFAISTNCHNVELAMQLIDYCYSDEGSMICNYGVEGDTYTMVDGTPRFTDKVLNNDMGLSLEFSFNVFCLQYGPFVEDYNRVSLNWSDTVYAACSVWSNSNLGESYVVPSYGVELTSEESSEYSVIYADIETYVSESLWKFVNGELSLDTYFTDFVATIENMNIARCIEIYQGAYDRYISH